MSSTDDGGAQTPEEPVAAPPTMEPQAPAAGTIPPAPSTIEPEAPAPGTIPPPAASPPPVTPSGDPAKDRIAAALPNYEVGGQLGKGGWGVVYEGRHRQLGRAVAIKELPENFSMDADVRERFIAEARTLAALDHPHVVPIYDYVEQDGLCLLVMEKLSGGTVWARFSTQGLSMEAACAAVLATCSGLQNAHEHNILHRDIKPENLIFNSEGTLKVTDFGIAKVLGGQRTMATAAGEVIGTPAYMAPEQARGKEVTPAADVYAVGVMLYELLSGRRPYEEEADPLALLFKHAYEDPEPLDAVAPQVPKPLVDVTMKALAREPGDRYQSAEEFGVAVAEAATQAWGAGWLNRASLPVMAASSIVAATQQVSVQPGTAPSSASVTVKPQTGGAPRVTVGPRAVDPSALVPVEDVVPKPPSAAPAWLGTVLLIAAVVIVAFGAPIGAIDRTGDLAKGAVTVAGQDPTAGKLVTLDLSKPFPIEGRVPAEGATRVEMAFTGAGVSLGTGANGLTINPNGTFTSSVDGSASRYLLTGKGTADLRFLDASGKQLTHQQFEVDSTQPAYLTAPFGAAILALFFLLGYVDSNLKALRRGKRRVTSVIGLGILGIPIGIATSVLAWGVTGREPAPASMGVSAAVAVAAGLAAGWGGLRSGRRRQYKRTQAAKAKAETLAR